MGGHGGLNILPQKRWNVYNFDNREKVKKDEEEAAKEEQLKREQSRKRDAEYRLEQLRTARGLAPAKKALVSAQPASESSKSESKPARPESESARPESEPARPESESRHINLFEGIKIFDVSDGAREGERGVETDGNKKKKMKKEEPPRVVTAEDEVYRLGYGLAGKGVKLPWYLAKKPSDGENDESGGDNNSSRLRKEGGKSGGKKTIEELREERLKREKQEKERTRVLVLEKGRGDAPAPRDRGYTRRNLKDDCQRNLKERITSDVLTYIHPADDHNVELENIIPEREIERPCLYPIMERSLLYLENLVLPSVIVITANIRCLHCQQRVSQLTSKITGLTEYTVDVNNKQVIIKGGFSLRYHLQNGKNHAIDENRLKKKLKQSF